ncbi:MAG: tyrosine-type recombinase/integrase [Kineosporiaceae bacterium]
MVDGARVEGTTKGGRERTVPLDRGTVELVRRHRARQEDERRIAGTSWVDGDWIFRRELGDPLYPDTVGALMAKLIRRHNDAHPEAALPVIRLHDLRHLHATLLLRAGVPVHVVAARVGHRDPAIMLRVYAHVIEQHASEVAQLFAAAVDGPVSTSVSSGAPVGTPGA